MSNPGIFYGIGVGPGDPELLTLKAVRILRSVEAIFCPMEASRSQGFAARILQSLEIPESKFRPVPLVMSRDRAETQRAYRETAETIAHEVRLGKAIAWVAEGDPLFFSTFQYLLDEMRTRFPDVAIEIVPGITSLQAGSARLGQGLVQLHEKLAVLPASYGLQSLPDLVERFETVVLLKIHSVFDELLDFLVGHPRVLAFYLERIGTPEERIVADLQSLRGSRLPYFSLVILKTGTRNES